MLNKGDLRVLSRLKKREGRIGLLALSGGARGVHSGACMIALNEYSLQDHFAVMVGISAGAWSVLYGASGQAKVGNTIYYEECATDAYFSLKPSRMLRGTMVDIGVVDKAARYGNKAVSLSRMYACKADLWVVVTDYATGRAEFVDLKQKGIDPITAVHASSATPIVYRRPVLIHGERKFDGVSNPFPSREVAEGWGLDGLIVFANRPETFPPSRKREVLEKVGIGLLPKHHKKFGRERHARFDEGIAFLREGTLPYLVVWTDEAFEMFERRPAVLKQAETKAYEHMKELIERAG